MPYTSPRFVRYRHPLRPRTVTVGKSHYGRMPRIEDVIYEAVSCELALLWQMYDEKKEGVAPENCLLTLLDERSLQVYLLFLAKYWIKELRLRARKGSKNRRSLYNELWNYFRSWRLMIRSGRYAATAMNFDPPCSSDGDVSEPLDEEYVPSSKTWFIESKKDDLGKGFDFNSLDSGSLPDSRDLSDEKYAVQDEETTVVLRGGCQSRSLRIPHWRKAKRWAKRMKTKLCEKVCMILTGDPTSTTATIFSSSSSQSSDYITPINSGEHWPSHGVFDRLGDAESGESMHSEVWDLPLFGPPVKRRVPSSKSYKNQRAARNNQGFDDGGGVVGEGSHASSPGGDFVEGWHVSRFSRPPQVWNSYTRGADETWHVSRSERPHPIRADESSPRPPRALYTPLIGAGESSRSARSQRTGRSERPLRTHRSSRPSLSPRPSRPAYYPPPTIDPEEPPRASCVSNTSTNDDVESQVSENEVIFGSPSQEAVFGAGTRSVRNGVATLVENPEAGNRESCKAVLCGSSGEAVSGGFEGGSDSDNDTLHG